MHRVGANPRIEKQNDDFPADRMVRYICFFMHEAYASGCSGFVVLTLQIESFSASNRSIDPKKLVMICNTRILEIRK